MSDHVVVISCNEDGDPPTIHEYTKIDFLAKLNDDWWGSDVKFAEPGSVPDTGSFVGLIVIEGRMVQPKAVEVVKRYEL